MVGKSLLVLVVGILLLEGFQCSRILFLIPITTISENHFYDPLIFKLGREGHSVTVVTSVSSSNLPENVTQLVAVTKEELYGGFRQIGKYPALDFISPDVFFHFIPYCHKIYENKEFQDVISREYDLVMSNLFSATCFFGVLHKIGAPYIFIEAFTLPHHMLFDLGTSFPSSTVPYPILYTSNRMTFVERLANFVVSWYSYVQQKLVVYPKLEKVYRKHLGEDVPSASEINRNVSLVMMNTHFTSTGPRPLSPDIIEIGCMHCKPANPLPQDLEDFISGSPHGFVYFSLGSTLDGSTLPNATREAILTVFSKLKLRVIWKYDTGEMESVPENVLVKKWLPQQDLLGHPKIRLFISQAGLMSTQQTIFHGAPALFLPIYFDQFSIAQTAVDNGMALLLDIHDFCGEQFEAAIHRLLTEPEFSENARLLSGMQRDQMGSPVEIAAFWTNYVLKYNGAPQLRSSARHLNILQIYSLDVIAALLASAAGLIGVFALLVYSLGRKILGLGDYRTSHAPAKAKAE